MPDTTEPASRWSVIAGYALVGAATQVLWLNFAGVTTVAAEHYGVSENAIGWLANVFPLVYVVLAIPAGLVLDRWFRGGLAAGAVLAAAGGLLRLAGDDYLWLLAGQVVVAIAQPLVLNAVTGVTGHYLRRGDRSTGIAVGTASTFAGMVLAFVLSAVMPAESQLRTLNGLGALFAVAAAVVMVLVLRRPGEHRHAAPAAGLRAIRTAWNDPFIRRVCALVFMPFGVSVALMTYAQALLEPAGVSSDTASVILLAQVVAGVIGCLVLPIWAARSRREVVVLIAAGLLSAAACAGLAVAPGVVVGYVTLVVIGLALLPALPVVLDLVERRTGEAEGTAAGLVWMTGQLGGVIVATVVGLLIDKPGPAFVLMAVAALVAVPIARSLRKPIAYLSVEPTSIRT